MFAQNKLKPEQTKLWEFEPQVVHPGYFSSPPSDAIVLFNESNFKSGEMIVLRILLNGL